MTISETHSNYNGFGVYYYGESDGSIDITVEGGTGVYTYLWSNGETTQDAGTYSVQVVESYRFRESPAMDLESQKQQINKEITES